MHVVRCSGRRRPQQKSSCKQPPSVWMQETCILCEALLKLGSVQDAITVTVHGIKCLCCSVRMDPSALCSLEEFPPIYHSITVMIDCVESGIGCFVHRRFMPPVLLHVSSIGSIHVCCLRGLERHLWGIVVC